MVLEPINNINLFKTSVSDLHVNLPFYNVFTPHHQLTALYLQFLTSAIIIDTDSSVERKKRR